MGASAASVRQRRCLEEGLRRQAAMTDEQMQAHLRNLLAYDPVTGLWTWQTRRGGTAIAGALAGNVNRHGYWVVHFLGRQWLAHRLAFLYMTGTVPAMVDHINRNRADCRWANLRPTTNSENLRNAKVNSKSKLGIKGVHQLRNGRFRAERKVNRTRVFDGCFPTAEEAHQAWVKSGGIA